eukprot:SAG31_NODE_2820_length_5041_cov_2.048968_6_plen_59_part_01
MCGWEHPTSAGIRRTNYIYYTKFSNNTCTTRRALIIKFRTIMYQVINLNTVLLNLATRT